MENKDQITRADELFGWFVMKEKNEIESKLTIYFEEPFWAGVFERIDNGKLSVCKVRVKGVESNRR